MIRGNKFYFRPNPLNDNEFSKCEGALWLKIGLPPSISLKNVPFLQFSFEDKSVAANCFSCLKSNNKTLCPHQNLEERGFEGVYTIIEIEHCLQLGYEIVFISRAQVYTDLKPLFFDFLSILASQKIRSEKVPEQYNNNLEDLAKEINEAMEFTDDNTKLSIKSFQANPGLRKSAKDIQNIVLGKFGQRVGNISTELLQSNF